MADQKPTVFAGLYGYFYNKLTGLFDDKELRCGVNGELHVVQGAGGLGFGPPISRIDNLLAVTRRDMWFPDGNGPTSIVIKYLSGTSPVRVHYVVDPISDAHVDAELANPPSQDANSLRKTVLATSVDPKGSPYKSEFPIRRISYLLSAADANSILLVEGA